MKSVVDEETQNAREDVFAGYLMYYQQVWPQGNLGICQETEVIEKAKRFLLTESNPDLRFTVFEFYRTVLECLTVGGRECQYVLKELVKATEFLEMLCVNLFLFPWKKEIKTLKTFTGPFVYWIKPVLPQNVLKSILESIGYHPETDMEYRLDKSADPEKATRMGFELFLARQECEYLLEVMGQNRPWECLEILQQRSPQTCQSLGEANEHVQEDKTEKTPAENEEVLLQDNREEDLDRGCSLVDPGVVPTEECHTFPEIAEGGDEDLGQHPRSLEFQAPDEPVEPGGGQSRGFITDDRSILEMRENYPDLTFRKKFLFGELQGQPAGQSRQKTPKTVAVAGNNVSMPSSTARLTESCPVTSVTVVSPKLTRHPPEVHGLEKDPVDTHHAQMPAPLQGSVPRGAKMMPENSQGDESIVSELAEKMGQMSVKDYHADMDLKYPVEETAWRDDGKATPLGSPRDAYKPIVCHPPQVPHSTISTCCTCEFSNTPRGDSTECNTIKEPPQDFYIPQKGMCAPPPSRGHTLQQEEEMLKTYVLVEHDQK